jgi:hypothetical protein
MATVKYGALELIPAPLVGVSLESRFFESDIRFSRSKVYSLQGTLLTNNSSGVSGIAFQQNDIITGFQNDYLPFTIDGQIIGYPKVNNISFDNGSWVRQDAYSIELEFLESGNPFQVSGAIYNLTGISGLFYNIESLTESLDYNTDFRTYSYTHSVDVQYRTGFNIDPILNAKLIASGLISNKSAFPFVTTGSIFGNKTYEERLGLFDGSYGVTESFEGTTGNSLFDHSYSLQLQCQENGITSVSQRGNIQGYDPNAYVNAKSGYNVIRNDIYQACSGYYSSYISGGILNSTFLTDSRTDNINEGKITYSRTFSDESGISNTRWQYTHQITLNNNDIDVQEQGNVIGLGHISERFFQASGFYITIVKPNIKQRTLEQFSGYNLTGNIFEVSREQSFDRFLGSIGYAVGFSNSPGIGAGSGIQNFNITITDDLPTHNRVAFNVVNQGVILQSIESTNQGQRTISLNSQAFRDSPTTGILQFSTNKLNEYRPTGSQFIDPFLQSISLNFNPNINSLGAISTYIYGGFKTDSDIKI